MELGKGKGGGSIPIPPFPPECNREKGKGAGTETMVPFRFHLSLPSAIGKRGKGLVPRLHAQGCLDKTTLPILTY